MANSSESVIPWLRLFAWSPVTRSQWRAAAEEIRRHIERLNPWRPGKAVEAVRGEGGSREGERGIEMRVVRPVGTRGYGLPSQRSMPSTCPDGNGGMGVGAVQHESNGVSFWYGDTSGTGACSGKTARKPDL